MEKRLDLPCGENSGTMPTPNLSETNKFKSYDDLPMVLAYPDLKQIFGVSRGNIYNLLKSEGFPSFKIGKQYRVNKVDLIEWLEQAGKNHISVEV